MCLCVRVCLRWGVCVCVCVRVRGVTAEEEAVGDASEEADKLICVWVCVCVGVVGLGVL